MKKDLRFPEPKRHKDYLELDKSRHYQVRTKNALIQNTSFSLTARQQKIILRLIQRISDKTTGLRFRFNAKDYANFLGIRPDSRNVKDIKQSLKQLADKSFWIRTKDINSDHPNDEYDTLVRWFSLVRYNRTKGYFEIEFNHRLKPYLLNVKNDFLSFDYHNIIGMTRSYSIRLYQIFVSHYNQQNHHYGFKYPLNQLRFQLGIPHTKYKRFSDFNRRVIQPSLREMNAKTNFNFYYNLVKHGRKTIGIRILLRKKSKAEQRQIVDEIDRKLTGEPIHRKSIHAREIKKDNRKESKAERAFRQDLRNAHTRGAKESELKERRESLRQQALHKYRKKKANEHKQARYKRYRNKYKK